MEREIERSLILIYAPDRSARLQYILRYLFEDVCGFSFQVTNDLVFFQQYSGSKICYSGCNISSDALHICPVGLLSDIGIDAQKIDVLTWEDLPVFFSSAGEIPFDLFSAAFYLVTRYEEYLPHAKDLYGRYDHRSSIAFKHQFLALPLIELWVQKLLKILNVKRTSSFHYLPSYDIDQAWSWKHKGFLRNLGGWMVDILTGKISQGIERLHVLWFGKQDPFFAFEWMDAFHQKYSIKPIYFFLVGKKNGKFDKHILPDKPEMKSLILTYADNSGLHPSWAAHKNDGCFAEEISQFKRITGKERICSRYHYIAFSLPEGYQRLINLGIKEDHSMGYGTINGFRASTSIPFRWFDLSLNQETDLIIHPFCWMDANSFYEQKLSTLDVLEELRCYRNILKNVSGQMRVIWHNNFLGTASEFNGWREVCEQFTSEFTQL